MPARKTTTANLAATAKANVAKIAAAAEAAKAVPVPETPTVLDGVVDKAGTNGKAAPKPKPAAKTAPKPAEDKPAPAPKLLPPSPLKAADAKPAPQKTAVKPKDSIPGLRLSANAY